MTPILLTVKETAELLGIGRSTLYEIMAAGQIMSVKRGASRRIPRWAVDDYIRHLCDDQTGKTISPAY